MSGTSGLEALFEPQSVAVIGASSTRGKNGNTVVRNLLRGGYEGRVIPVNASGSEVEGLGSVVDIRQADGPVDCAMVMIPAAQVVDAVRGCAAVGVKSVIVGAAGFAESGSEEGARWQAELSQIARDAGMRILGPNTNGLYNASAHLPLGYNGTHGEVIPHVPISILSHSGALFGGIARSLVRCGSGLEKFVSVGNEADIGLLDLFEMLIEDPKTEIIGLVIESLSDGARFRRLARQARDARKSVIVLKIGRSRVGAEASLAHSSRMAGSARAYEALFNAAGVGTVPSPEALAGACAVLVGAPPRKGASGLLCVSTSGAGGALLADYAEDRGLALAGDRGGAWRGTLAEEMAALPMGGAPRNPIDVGALRDWSRIGPIFDVLAQGGIDGPTVAFAHIAPRPNQDETLVSMLAAHRRKTAAPVVVSGPGGLRPEIEALYASEQIPVFHDLATAMDSVAPWVALSTAMPDAMPPLPKGAVPPLPEGEDFLDEKTSGDVLRAAGVPVVETREGRDPETAARAAEELGFPVVLKALAPGVLHKAREGHVVVGLNDAASVRTAVTAMQDRLAGQGYDVASVPMIVQPMRKGRLELIVGATHEPPLGHFLLVGLGGIATEILDRSVLLPVPMTRDAFDRTLGASQLAPLFDLVGQPARDSLIDLLFSLQQFVVAHGDVIRSVDLNPVLIGDEGCVAVDAAIVLDTTCKGNSE